MILKVLILTIAGYYFRFVLENLIIISGSFGKLDNFESHNSDYFNKSAIGLGGVRYLSNSCSTGNSVSD